MTPLAHLHNTELFQFPEKIKIKTETETFNHTHLVVLIAYKVFCCKKKGDPEWSEEEPLLGSMHEVNTWYEIPLPPNTTPKSIKVDGANMVMIDTSGFAHYKKMIREWRVGQNYIWRDKTSKPNWKERGWYTFPYVNILTRFAINTLSKTLFRFIPKELRDQSHLISYFCNTLLKIPEPNRGFHISHRGQLCRIYRDAVGKEHMDDLGVTTFFWLAGDGKSLWYADPWLPFGFVYQIPFPDDKNFVAQSFSPSASTIFLAGHTIKDGKKNRKFYVGQLDFDILGWHPLRKYTRDKNNEDPQRIFLPPLGWIEQPEIPLMQEAKISKKITILQTEKINKGIGNDARKLHVPVIDENNNTGYWTKPIAGMSPAEWKFKPFKLAINEEDILE